MAHQSITELNIQKLLSPAQKAQERGLSHTISDCSEMISVVRNGKDRHFCDIILFKYNLISEKLS